MGKLRRWETRDEEAARKSADQEKFREFLVGVLDRLGEDERLMVFAQSWGDQSLAYLRVVGPNDPDDDTKPDDVRLDTTYIGLNPFVRLHTAWSKSACDRFALKTTPPEKVVQAWRAHLKDQAEGRRVRRANAVTAADDKAAGEQELGFTPYGQFDHVSDYASPYMKDHLGTGLDSVTAYRAVNATLRYKVQVPTLDLTADQVKRLIALVQEKPA